ncbi:coiled-coil domain-containing protein 28B-like isoform X3 [Dinothrombium tinctorium]|uniref:Coiled-coil domain-containing protein 28B-like isoform X3 n=1 Tax=Dinothrombium tinctorium TaxID=1965070 RepID=A0A3S3QW48_9ACAR|nr:coiled-coil domain-containing protein 28B-like isoform X3 [Dinothrombium tinctorium]RWS14328.1 coiled-coil domain-containing protein 28B-like isoform X3 [Dinothrombium tinctorium]RWS14355.1 coiled-coil domain-containing protein 28B-like isoform X3 [Dinothrombium tinctorium]RWS14941.1 coiled-coil domain-containing protein 28B-like isoform X3 [Dinothrombium tinctorium]
MKKSTEKRIKDVADVQQMEEGLLQLLDDFHSGKLQAFGKDITFEKMDSVREQQEKLARLHFDLNAQQEIYGHDSEDKRRVAKENMQRLTENLQQLSFSMYDLINCFTLFVFQRFLNYLSYSEQLQSRKPGPNFTDV